MTLSGFKRTLKMRRKFQPRSTRRKATKALSLVKKVISSQEKKVFDVDASAAISTTPTLLSFFTPSEGDGYGNRSGIVCSPKMWSIKFQATRHASATQTFVRIILFRCKWENSTAPVSGDVVLTSYMDSAYPYTRKNKIQILYDKVHNMCGSDNTGFFLNIKRFPKGPVNFYSDGTVIENGGFYALLTSTEPTNTPTLDYYSRITFTDS